MWPNMDAATIARLAFHLKKTENKLDNAAANVKHSVDTDIENLRDTFQKLIDQKMLPQLVLHDKDFMVLIKADKKTQDAWLKQFEKALGLSPKQPKATTETREETMNKARGRQPSAEQMYQKMISKKGLNF